jgi:ribosome-associated translation inhibitor RaiA
MVAALSRGEAIRMVMSAGILKPGFSTIVPNQTVLATYLGRRAIPCRALRRLHPPHGPASVGAPCKEDQMNLQIAIRGIDDKATLRSQAEARVAATLDRFQGRVHDVSVLLEDVTGPHKQVVDKRCRIDVRLKRGKDLTIDEVGTDVLASLARALDRLKATVGRRIGQAKRGVGAG